jgi:ABC-type bacteriocin/lantibiotic exporter with double-glycine peptidase domain
MGWFDLKENGTGSLTYQLSNDADRVQALSGSMMGNIVQLVVTVAAGLAIAFYFSWALTLIILCVAPLMGAASMLQIKVLAGSGQQIKLAYSGAAQGSCDAMQNIRTVHALAQQEHFLNAYAEKIQVPHRQAVRQAWIGSLGTGFSQGVVFAVYALAFYSGYRLVSNPNLGLSVRNMFIALFSVVFSAIGAGRISTFGPNAAKAKVAAASIFEWIRQLINSTS